MANVFYYPSPAGRLGIAEDKGLIEQIFFADIEDRRKAGYDLVETPIIKEAAKQLDEYFAGKRKDFDLPLKFIGTDFQKKVWQALTEIPYGQLRSYKDIAIAVDSPKGFRAVGLANNRNPIVIVVPCHRVVGHSGSLTGYGGGLGVKDFLLKLEGAQNFKSL
ncbi:MAG TPA: methylated-DNA--[protein]-cysteine S-methyltransferase [Clostridiales bacterium]|jgi:methylated-DNA-[protein]-cysteine S-methyltransferase|nr:methylated-DNA--[protein]-cysteine S-methyltransferase [Clostridiales bacterium]